MFTVPIHFLTHSLGTECASIFVLVTLGKNQKKTLADRDWLLASRTIELGCI
jgi:hypothetical protein